MGKCQKTCYKKWLKIKTKKRQTATDKTFIIKKKSKKTMIEIKPPAMDKVINYRVITLLVPK